MASSSESMDMDESFRARVDKVFGSLPSSKSSSSPAWSLTDDEVERRKWRRDTDTSDRDETPCSASFDGFSVKDRKVSRRNRSKDFDDDGGGDERRQEDDGIDDWEIRSSIGLDPTLDREEEEDEYDKVASGRENAGDRLYMSDVTDHGSYLNSHNVLPKTKDPRANHMAAKIRLKEDEAEGQKFSSSETRDRELEEPHVKASGDGCQPKSILKRKDSDTVFKSRKRVRFDPDFIDDGEIQDAGISASSVDLQNESYVAQNTSRVPDYVLNPSKYKHYTFDSSGEIDEESNTEACMYFLKQVQRSNPTESSPELDHTSADLPKSVTFIPKKKGNDANSATNSSEVKQHKEDDNKQSANRASHPVGIAAGEGEQIEADAMDEDVADKGAFIQKPGRRYRTVSRFDDSDS